MNVNFTNAQIVTEIVIDTFDTFHVHDFLEDRKHI